MSKYRTAQGKIVDMGAMATRHEKTRAVGNMNVNARGDTLDSQNRVIKDNTKRVNRTYAKTVQENKQPLATPAPKQKQPKINPNELSASEREFLDDDEDFQK